MASSVETLIRKTVSAGVSKVAEFNRNRMDETVRNPYLTGIHTPMDAERTFASGRTLPPHRTLPAITGSPVTAWFTASN
jgi:8'-apo-carotenoid 13,14-cleaving dioxygenase